MATSTTEFTDLGDKQSSREGDGGASNLVKIKAEPTGSQLEFHYNELLKVIEDIGRDVKPAYTTSKVSTDKLRKNIMIARGVLRECMSDLDKLASTLQ